MGLAKCKGLLGHIFSIDIFDIFNVEISDFL